MRTKQALLDLDFEDRHSIHVGWDRENANAVTVKSRHHVCRCHSVEFKRTLCPHTGEILGVITLEEDDGSLYGLEHKIEIPIEGLIEVLKKLTTTKQKEEQK